MSDEGNKTANERPGRGRWLIITVATVALAIGAVISGRWLWHRLTHVTTDAAYVKADMAEVAPEVAGRVREVLVHEGDRVTAGQVLVRLQDDDWQHKRDQAGAKVAEVQQQVTRRQAVVTRTRAAVAAAQEAAAAGVAAAREQLVRAEAAAGYLTAQERRLAALLAQQAVPQARYDEVHAGADAARADVKAARQGVKAAEAHLAEARAARASIDEATAGLAETEAGVEQANAALAQVEWALGRAEIRAPIAGVIARVFVRVGDFAPPGRPVLALYDPATRYVEARFEETRVAGLRVGQPATLEFDALPGTALRGAIRRIAPAAAQEFALIPRDVTAGEFTKVTQRVAVELDIAELAAHDELVPGLSVEVSVPKRWR
jgi:membrane fusion protein (multidrug efflux system)